MISSKLLKTIQNANSQLRQSILALGAVFIAFTGYMLLTASKAATPTTKFEAENATLASGAVVGSDNTASNGQFTQFNPSPIPPPPPPPPPAGGCPPFPAFPDASCTGYQHTGVVLSNYTGPATITASNTVIDGKLFPNGIAIRAKNVTIKRSKIIGTIDLGYDLNVTNGVLFEDMEMDGGNSNLAGIGAGGFTCRRCNLHHAAKGIQAGDFTLEDSYIHDLYGVRNCQLFPSDCISHNEAILAYGDNITVKHSNLDSNFSSNSSGGGMSAVLAMYTHTSFWPALNNVLIEKTRMRTTEAHYCVYAGNTSDSDGNPSNVRFIDNVWVRNPNGTCGMSGPIVGWLRGNGNVWTNNKWSDGAILPEPSSENYN